jgi:hypothetical protein
MYAHESYSPTTYNVNDSIKSHVNTNHRRRILLRFRALNVKNIEGSTFALGLGRSDPFLTLSKKHSSPESGRVRWQRVYKSEPIMNHANPVWEEFQIHLDDLCDDDLNRPLLIQIWDYEASGKHRPIGQVEASTSLLMERRSRVGNADRKQSLHFQRPDNSGQRGMTRDDVLGELIVLQAKQI